MPSSSSKRARHTGGDRGRGRASSPVPRASVSPTGSTSSDNSMLAVQHMISNYKETVLNMVLGELESEAASGKIGLPCPFQRRNPRRYRHVKDPACKNERGFKNIADLKDHIKRSHSSKYGCHYCKVRFQKRDHGIDVAAKEHRKKCKWYINNRVAEVSKDKPEVMSPEQDKLYFQLDFRRDKDYPAEDKLYSQYWAICKTIWPEYESQEVFDQLDLRNRNPAIDVARLSEIMNYAMDTVDIGEFVTAAWEGASHDYAVDGDGGGMVAVLTLQEASRSTSDSSHASYQNSPGTSPRSSFAASQSQAFECVSSSADGGRADYDSEHQPAADDDEAQYDHLNGLYAVPQPERYAATDSRAFRDSAYGSGSNEGAAADDRQNCYQYGNEALGDQMLTDPVDCTDRDIQLSGIQARDDVGTVSPGYYNGIYDPGLSDDDLMMGGAGAHDGFY